MRATGASAGKKFAAGAVAARACTIRICRLSSSCKHAPTPTGPKAVAAATDDDGWAKSVDAWRICIVENLIFEM